MGGLSRGATQPVLVQWQSLGVAGVGDGWRRRRRPCCRCLPPFAAPCRAPDARSRPCSVLGRSSNLRVGGSNPSRRANTSLTESATYRAGILCFTNVRAVRVQPLCSQIVTDDAIASGGRHPHAPPLPEPTRALLGCSQIDCETRRCPRGVPLGPVGCDFAPPKDHLAAVTATSIARASAPRRP